MSAEGPTIRCAGCGTIHSASLIRCPDCGNPTRSSRDYWRTHVPPIDKPAPLHLIGLALAIWALIGAAIWWAYG